MFIMTQNLLQVDLQQRLSKFPGKIPVYLRLDTKGYKSVQIMVGEDLFVAPCHDLIEEIKILVGQDNFSMSL